jgi:hypothetical protein
MWWGGTAVPPFFPARSFFETEFARGSVERDAFCFGLAHVRLTNSRNPRGRKVFDHLRAHAEQGGADAVIGVRCDANDIKDGITEVLAYGTAVWVERLGRMTRWARTRRQSSSSFQCFPRLSFVKTKI